MDAGLTLIASMQTDEWRALSDDDKWRRVQAFEAAGAAAVTKADEAQLSRWNDELVGSPSPRENVRQRVKRLQDIQDRL